MKELHALIPFLALGLFLGFLQLASSRLRGHNANAFLHRGAHFSKAPKTRLFLGRIMEVEGKFVLRDSLNDNTYLLDDQDKAEPFKGRQVEVIGRLDAANKTIHVL